MREFKVKTQANGTRLRVVDGPENWEEACAMLETALNGFNDRRGGNATRAGAAARVAFSLFPHAPTDDPTTALVRLMHAICQHHGAGLAK